MNPPAFWRRPRQVLFGQMYEDPSIELAAFRPGGRIFCIASAGCMAMKLAPRHEVVAVDVNPIQLAYAASRWGGAEASRGVVEKIMSVGRSLLRLAGWSPLRLRAFLELDDPSVQIEFWHRHLDTWRFRRALDGLFSPLTLLRFVPHHLGRVMRSRMERCFARHSNRRNPYARALLLGELSHEPAPPEAKEIGLAHADAAAYLEQAPAGSFDGFTLSNILDGATPAYAGRLFSAIQHAGAPGAVVVLRSFAEAPAGGVENQAAEDRSFLWGSVEVRPV